VESRLRHPVDRDRSAPLDESASTSTLQTRLLAAEVRVVRSKGQTIPIDNKEAKKGKPLNRVDPLKRQLLKNSAEQQHAQGREADARPGLQPEDISPRSHC